MPSAYALSLVQFARRRQIDLESEAGVQLTPGELIESSLSGHLMTTFNDLSPDPAWAFDFAKRLGMSAHGVLGVLALSAESVSAGLLDMSDYLNIRTPLARTSHEEESSVLTITVEYPWEAENRLRLSCEILATVYRSLVDTMTGEEGLPIAFAFPYPAPTWEQAYRLCLGEAVSFGAEAFQLKVDQDVAAMPSVFRDDSLHQSARRKCDETLARQAPPSTAAQVRMILADRYGRRIREAEPTTHIPTSQEIAAELELSQRTLMRRLRESGHSIQTIRDDLLRSYLQDLFSRGKLGAAEIGMRLGYEDPANFTRACRRLTGQTPNELTTSRWQMAVAATSLQKQ